MTPDKKPKFPLCSKYGAIKHPNYKTLWKFENSCAFSPKEMSVIELALSKAEEQGKLDLVELIRKEMDKMGDDEPGGIMCHRRECFEPGICFHEIERLARLKSQISEKRVLSEVSSQESSKQGAK
jgi:hypothetical protein